MAAKEEPLWVEAGGREVAISSPSKVFFPARQETKGDLVRFYVAVEDAVMRQMADRPVLLQRFPDGARGNSFFQKRIPATAPEWLQTTIVTTPNGTESRALVIADLAHLLWAVNIGCIGFHSWPVRLADLEHPDELRIDLDPQPGTTFAMAQEAAAEVHRLFEGEGITSYIKTSGSRGLHVYVRLHPRWDPYEVRSAAVAVARELERRRPDLITAQWWKVDRGERIFIDFNQNAPHKTVFAPWSVRAFDLATVSFPFPWDELPTINPLERTIATVPDIVAAQGDAWLTMNDEPQTLEPLLDMVVADQDNGLPDAPWPPVYPKMPGEPPRVDPKRRRATD
jgi:DNA ligase D